jgi:hypothetical protein
VSPAYSRGEGRELLLVNITYEEEGLWRCTAHNIIKGEERRVHSQVLRLGVTGRPLVMAAETKDVQQASLLEDKSIEVNIQATFQNPVQVFCDVLLES